LHDGGNILEERKTLNNKKLMDAKLSAAQLMELENKHGSKQTGLKMKSTNTTCNFDTRPKIAIKGVITNSLGIKNCSNNSLWMLRQTKRRL
jgi:hypothetical protein